MREPNRANNHFNCGFGTNSAPGPVSITSTVTTVGSTRCRLFRLGVVALAAVHVIGCSDDSPEPLPWPPQDSVELITYAEDVRDRFLARAADLGFDRPFVPTMDVETTPSLISYDHSTGRVVMPLWAEVDAGVQAGFDMYGAELAAKTGQQFFEETMNWFVIAHEIGHFVQFSTGQNPSFDRYASELNATQIAVAFWIAENEAERVATYAADAAILNAASGSPVPVGADEVEFFNENYDEIGDMLQIYGWYQFEFAKKAFAMRAENDFASLIEIALGQ